CTLAPDPEALAQARSGLMAVHGREQGRPRRLGLDVASVAAGILASQAVLAALLARRRGLQVEWVETSVLEGALTFLEHHVAIETAGAALPPDLELTGPGPPFQTSDGYWVELECLKFDRWLEFWKRLGLRVPEDGLADAWSTYAPRYLTGVCTLPVALHDAAARASLAELEAAAGPDIAICRL